MKTSMFISGCVILTGLSSVLSGCTSAIAQDQPSTKTSRSISVSGTGSTRVKPDVATATVGTSKASVKLPEAKSACDASIAKIKAALKKAGVPDEEVQTVQYQIYRVTPQPLGGGGYADGIREPHWKVVHMVQVRTKKPDTIADLVDTSVAAGATDVQNVSFSVDGLAKHRVKARELAVAAAKDKAVQLASLFGVTVGEVITIVEGGEYYPQAQMMSNMAFDASPGMGGGSGISGGQLEVTASVSVVFGIR